jgi:hypothetical protein
MKLICISWVLLLISCSRHQPTTEQENPRSDYFKNTFLKKFKIIGLPCEIGEGKRIYTAKLLSTDPGTLDSLFIQSSSLLCYGLLADTSRFYTLVFYAPAVTYVPILSTFDKLGNKIFDYGIDFGCWDGGPGEYDCEGHLLIDKEMNLNFEHVITCYDCDSTSSKPIQYIDKRKGKIESDGQIELETSKIK